MVEKELTCISCPLGCMMTVSTEGENITVSGNSCKRGEIYAKKEILNPTRIVTSSVPIENGDIPMLSVKTEQDIPKHKIMDVMKEIHQVKVAAPIEIGDTVISNCAGTGVSVVATKNIKLIV